MSRPDKVAEEIKRETSLILQGEVHDPRLGFVTITHVDVSADLKVAKIFFSVYGDAQEWAETEAGLNAASGFIRRLLGDRLLLRYVPEIMFRADHSSEYSIIIEQKLQEIKSEKEAERQPKAKVKHGPKKTTRVLKKKRA